MIYIELVKLVRKLNSTQMYTMKRCVEVTLKA